MKRKHKQILAILLSLCLASATATSTVAMAASAAEHDVSVVESGDTPVSSEDFSDSSSEDSSSDTGDSSEEPSVPDSGEDGETTPPVLLGWQTIDGKTYYYNENGEAVTGNKKIDGKRYYFGKDGVLFTKTGFQKIYTRTYYFTSDHSMKQGWFDVDGNRYYTSKINGEVLTGWRTIGEKKYYFNTKGQLYQKTGWQTIDGDKYYFRDGNYVQQLWKTIDGNKYYFGNSGVMRTGWRNIDDKVFYFNGSGVMQKDQWRLRDGHKQYYLRSNGSATTGWKTIKGYRYYFGSNGVLDEDVRNRSDVKGPYRLIVNKKDCTVLVLARDAYGNYNTPAVKFTCSVGLANTPTPSGTFYANRSARWQPLMGPSWGQYGTHVVNGIFFHSVAGATKSIYNVSPYAYNLLGSPASHGCIRLTVRDAKWIYDNAASGNQVRITSTGDRSVISYFQKPILQKLGPNQNWDPTDPIASKEQGGNNKPSDDTKPSPGETLLRYKTTTDVNYRTSPSLSGNRAGTLSWGTIVNVVKGCSKDADGMTWYKIKNGTKYYYIASQYLVKA